ncbi:Gfo/Idh/MocA family oxidoreductase [bacterium SCSIO 12741]|nr:Gfo/Idh/MocA family oxidoreductase [bacterium SCSIO 12741]
MVRFSIFATGHIAQRHARHIIDHPNANLTGVFDIDSDKAANFADRFQTSWFRSPEELFNSPTDIVVICSPSGLHAEHAIQALNHGKHVLVEKPMALAVKEAEDMIEASQQNGKGLFVVKQNRYNPPVKKVKELIDTGALGQVYQVSVNAYWNRPKEYYLNSDWKGTRKLDGGTLFNQFSHFVDILYYLFGSIKEANGFVRNAAHQPYVEFEDTGSISFEMENGVPGTFSFTTAALHQNMEGSVTVFAENATLKIGGKYLNSLEYKETEGFSIDNLPISAPANNYGFYEGSMSNHDKVIDNVVNTLMGTEKIMTPATDGLRVVEMITQMYDGAKFIR